MRIRPLLLALSLVSAPALAQASGWTLETAGGVASLAHGEASSNGAFRLECAGGNSLLTTWVRQPPRNLQDETFETGVRVFQGSRELVFAASGTAKAEGPTRIDTPIADPAGLLEGARRNGRLVVVTYAGRATAPAPEQAKIETFLLACKSPQAPANQPG
ncbi:hypothetical protein L6Q21_17485 [Sandaracinobacter sp. RS1-74]|uniref:hypothetical protein n=1 Tax=Sandaracinobacteroides sayramensis TaxID=2913411 RepID=UPI001EDB4269|nr:hypothetical protein [Sandaracinobacteroides sayramensis]MCG2842772.1 hypothetical protein [Sandaracinobacteroides sayramensis]